MVIIVIEAGAWGLEKSNVDPFFKGKEKDPKIYRLVGFTSTLWKAVHQIILKNISKHIKDKKVIGSNQHGFTKGSL